MLIAVFTVLVGFGYSATLTEAAKPVEDECAAIKDGTIHYTYFNGDHKDEIMSVGYDDSGYNYQARMYNGDYFADGSHLLMKWSDSWLSNKDCATQNGREGEFTDDVPDGRLDRHLGFNSYRGSGAWLTNHWSNEYTSDTEYTWDISGDWTLDFAGGNDNRKFVNLVQDAEGNVTGEFWYLSGATWLNGGALTGTLTGDDLYLHYERPYPLTYTGEFYGVIGDSVISDGTFTDSHGNELTWTADGASTANFLACFENEFIKIVAAPEGSDRIGPSYTGVWYDSEDVRIGVDVWDQFAIIQYNYTDTCDAEASFTTHERMPGLGNW